MVARRIDIARITPRPILIIHGGRDSIVDPNDATLLYAAAQEPKELWFLPNANHLGAYFEDRYGYVKKVLEFFDLHLRHVGHLQLLDTMSTTSLEASNQEGTSENLSEAS
jgi:alpha-beta hydrolase superfamily lysophospholipase